MNWHSSGEFLAMGGYGVYVWGAYGVTAVLMLAEVVSAIQRRRRAQTQAIEWSQSESNP